MFCKDIGAAHGLRMLIATLPILAIMAILASGHQLPPGNHKLCGPALSDAMDLVCAHGYNSLAQKRTPHPVVMPRADYSSLGRLLLSNLYGLGGDLDGDVASGLLIKTRRQRRHLPGGVYDECCVYSCTYEELSAYCLPK